MMAFWNDAFKTVLGHASAHTLTNLLDVRNKLSHNETFTYDDAERALDSMRRLMEAISAGETADQIGKMRDTILRTKYAELQRNEERRKTQRLNISVETVAGLLPWREVVEPHKDVATGEFQQAEFAADLGKVHSGSAPSEYRDPKEFYSRTYLTDGLSMLLVGARQAACRSAAAIRSSSCRRISAAARPTRCSRSITWSAALRRRTCRASINCLNSTAERAAEGQSRGAGRHVTRSAGCV